MDQKVSQLSDFKWLTNYEGPAKAVLLAHSRSRGLDIKAPGSAESLRGI
jgi:hypothetical protein